MTRELPSIDPAQLENVKHLDGGAIRAACPACRASGSDKSGEHLLIQPGGKFGCAANPGDGEHRKEIFRLAGTKTAPKPASRIVATYDYRDRDGKTLFQVVRYEPKDFRQRRPDGKGGWIWNMDGVEKVLFRQPEIVRAIAGEKFIFLCEGEKDVESMAQCGFDATCNPGGAAKKADGEKWLTGYTETLRGADVCIIADKDGDGRKHAQIVAGKLHGVAKSVRVIELPDTTGKPVKDAADFFTAGGKPEAIIELVDTAPTWTPQAALDPLPCNDDPPEQTTPQPPAAKSLGDLQRRTADDPNELLRTGYLCRGGGLLLAAPTGIGKSSFGIQAQIMFALGRPMFGIQPARPLRSLYIQAENDDGDLAEMRDGVIAGLDLSPGELETVYASIITAHENTRTLRAFFENTIAPLLELHRPDLLWIDPALSYIGSDASTQKDVGFFLRNLLNPLLTKHGCGCVVIHHTNKPSKGEEKSAWQAGDFAYLGSGSAEWANWARAVLAIRSVGSHEVFELRAGKRGSRIGWKDDDGKTSFARLIGHATEPGVICWRTATEDETPAGKPRRPGTREDLIAIVPLEKPIAKALLLDQWKDRYGNKDKGRAFLDSLIADVKLFEWKMNRSGTNAAKLIARKQQNHQ